MNKRISLNREEIDLLTTQAVITEIPERNGNGMRGGMSPDLM